MLSEVSGAGERATCNYHCAAGERDALQAENAELRARTATEETHKPLLTRERETALKLIIGMAIEQYGYDPDASRNDAIKNISEDLAEWGLFPGR